MSLGTVIVCRYICITIFLAYVPPSCLGVLALTYHVAQLLYCRYAFGFPSQDAASFTFLVLRSIAHGLRNGRNWPDFI